MMGDRWATLPSSVRRRGDWATPAPAGTKETATITGLTENVTYYVGLQVIDDQGNASETSNILRVKIPGRSVPEAVADLVIEDLRPDGVTLNWTAPQQIFGENSKNSCGTAMHNSGSKSTNNPNK